MRVIIATNELYGTYHTRALAVAAQKLGVELIQWCPEAFNDPQVTVTAKREDLKAADLIVHNGLLSSHTLEAAELSVEYDIPLGFVELAYLTEERAPDFPLTTTACISPASAITCAAHLGLDPTALQVSGTPLLDNLPRYTPRPREVLGLTSVSGEGVDPEQATLREVLLELKDLGYQVKVRTHPREDQNLWRDFELDLSPRPAYSLAMAAFSVGVAGTAVWVATALGVPFVSVGGQVPEYLQGHRYKGVDLNKLDILKAPGPAERDHICGPIGGAAERIIKSWLSLDL